MMGMVKGAVFSMLTARPVTRLLAHRAPRRRRRARARRRTPPCIPPLCPQKQPGRFPSNRLSNPTTQPLTPSNPRAHKPPPRPALLSPQSLVYENGATSAEFPPGRRWLDLFAGTGAVGLEALSRGCQEAHFVELDAWVRTPGECRPCRGRGRLAGGGARAVCCVLCCSVFPPLCCLRPNCSWRRGRSVVPSVPSFPASRRLSGADG